MDYKREGFETWVVDKVNVRNLTRSDARTEDGYANTYVDMAWEAWKAAVDCVLPERKG